MNTIESTELAKHKGEEVSVKGHIHAIRRLGNLTFILLRDQRGIIQIVVDQKQLLDESSQLVAETALSASGIVQLQEKTNTAELKCLSLRQLSHSSETLPVEINKENKLATLSPQAMFDYRPLTLRAPSIKAIFKIQAAILTAFREFLTKNEFTEIHSPKIVSTGTEGGAQLFSVDYFGRQAYLAQSPQFYKQIMVGVFERVFEIGPVYRAELHETSRHLNEYISLDFEMGFIESEQDVIAMETNLLKHIFAFLKENCSEELRLFGIDVPELIAIPQLTLCEAIALLNKYGWQAANEEDLDPEAERLLCQHFLNTENTEMVFITSYPRQSRPFYAMPAGELTKSFDLLFKGLEITTGGQRIHEYAQLVESIRQRGMDESAFVDYLQCFKYGMPPHGGLAIGLERLVKQLLNLSNVRQATLFPRDRSRLTP